MTKYLIIFIISFPITCSFGQVTKANLKEELIIEPTITTEVEKYIDTSEFSSLQSRMLIYNNRMLVDLYEDDKFITSAKEEDNKNSIFKSFYYWEGDTLGIDGAFGLFGGAGFSIKIIKDKAILYHLLASDEFPSYAYKEKDSLIFRLEVPCTETKIVLSEIPALDTRQVIYGYVEFKSSDYYASSGSDNGQEILPRKKLRANMRIYFKSGYFEF